MERAVLAEGDHVVDALANGLGPNHRGRDAAVTDDLRQEKTQRTKRVASRVLRTVNNSLRGKHAPVAANENGERHFRTLN